MPNGLTNNDIKFSIIIPSCNYARFLNRAISSAINQSGDDYEVLVINDGSTDDTCAVVNVHLNNAGSAKLRYYRQENVGVSATRNRGIDLSVGRFLIFLDADDELAEEALDHLRSLIEEVPDAGMLVGGHYTVFKDGSQKRHDVKNVGLDRKKNFYNFLRKKISMANGAIALNRSVFEKIRYADDLPQAEDIPVFGQAFANFDCYPVPYPLVKVHRHANSRRRDINLAREGGFQVVDYLFNPALLPAECMPYKEYFYVRKCLSLFRHFYKEGAYQEAATYYHMAFARRPFTALRLSYFRKYFLMRIKPNKSTK
jgi:glycosyltransferase involved in cell wall biosynthesis